MNIARMLEAVGLGAARDARMLVGRLPRATMRVATPDEPVARALGRARHERASIGSGHGEADAALALDLPDGEDGLVLLDQLIGSTRRDGLVIIATTRERARVAGLFLRAGLQLVHQDSDGGTIVTTGRVLRA